MKIEATHIDLTTAQVEYTILTDDEEHVISAGRRVDYSSAIATDPKNTTLGDVSAVVAADAVAAKEAIKAQVNQAKSAAEAAISAGQEASASADEKLASLDTAPVLITSR